jgi:hypothetical protein
MNKKELQEFYERHHDDWVYLYSFGEQIAEIKLHDLVKLIRTVETRND